MRNSRKCKINIQLVEIVENVSINLVEIVASRCISANDRNSCKCEN